MAAISVNGVKVLATLKEGWRARFLRGQLCLAHPNHPARLVDPNTVKEGDILPRDTDAVIDFSTSITGQ